MGDDVSVRILATSAGNEFMVDIARVFAAGFAEENVECELAIDALPSPTPSQAIQLVVAPHEYFPLLVSKEVDGLMIRRALGCSHVLNVEQPGSRWFDLACEYARQALGVFDISREGVAEFRRRGISARHTPLGYTDTLEAPVVDRPSRRRIDILFMGHTSRRREEFFARHAAFFSGRNCRLILTDVARPRRPDTPGYYSGSERLSLLASSKILINVHSTERTYFETHRALLAMANHCVLVTEASRYTEPLENGRHFVMAALDELPEVCQRLLLAPQALDTIADAAHEFGRASLHVKASCRAMLSAIATSPKSPSAEVRVGHDSVVATGGHIDRRRAVMRRLAEADARKKTGEPRWDLEPSTAYGNSLVPAISVIVTLYNYASFIAECLSSVVCCDPVPGGIEIVVVDDGSSDGSLEEVKRFMLASPLPVLLIMKRWNTGLADARNVGLE
jgi:hypothetical protein